MSEPSKKNSAAPAEPLPTDQAEDLPPELAEILPKLPPEARRVIREISISAVVGPIPPPELLAQYDPEIRAKFPEWADQQQHHRMDLERRQVAGAEWRMNFGQWVTGATALSSMVIGGGVMIAGGMTWAAVVGGIAIVAIGVGGPSVAAAFPEVIARWLEKDQSETAGQQRKKPPKRR